MQVCYFTNRDQMWKKKTEKTYRPVNVDNNLCTHIVLAFANVSKEYELVPCSGHYSRNPLKHVM